MGGKRRVEFHAARIVHPLSTPCAGPDNPAQLQRRATADPPLSACVLTMSVPFQSARFASLLSPCAARGSLRRPASWRSRARGRTAETQTTLGSPFFSASAATRPRSSTPRPLRGLAIARSLRDLRLGRCAALPLLTFGALRDACRRRGGITQAGPAGHPKGLSQTLSEAGGILFRRRAFLKNRAQGKI